MRCSICHAHYSGGRIHVVPVIFTGWFCTFVDQLQVVRSWKAMPTFEVEAMVRGYHVYKEIWDASIGEELLCAREPTNPCDPFAIAVVKSNQTVGHVPLKISSVCSLFLRHGGTIMCKITGRRQHSKDLAQGGLEIPCTMTLKGARKILPR